MTDLESGPLELQRCRRAARAATTTDGCRRGTQHQPWPRHARQGAAHAPPTPRRRAERGPLEALLSAGVGDDFGAEPKVLQYLLWEALRKRGKAGALGELQDGLTDREFGQFLDRCPLAEALLNELFFAAGGFGGLVEVPVTMKWVRGTPRLITVESRLLSPAMLTVLEWLLPHGKHAEWENLFSSHRDGASFQRLKAAVEEQGATVIVLQDDGGHVFGGFAAADWSPSGEFFGNDAGFLFSITPEPRVFRPDGVNANYQYFNSMQETLPNGLAFGGQLGYFGLHVSGDYDHGHCKGHPLSSTYGNPVLSHAQDFKVIELEAWRVGPEPRDEFAESDSDAESAAAGDGRSILDKATKTDKAVLELAGRKMHSDSLREPIPEEPVVYRADGKVKRPVY